MRSSKDSSFLHSARLGCGCLLWYVLPLTLLTWWLGGRKWGSAVMAVTIFMTLCAMCLTPLYKRTLKEVETYQAQSRGAIRCHRCNGSGWIVQDMYNEETCPLCNGSGWEDDPRPGPPLSRAREGE